MPRLGQFTARSLHGVGASITVISDSRSSTFFFNLFQTPLGQVTGASIGYPNIVLDSAERIYNISSNGTNLSSFYSAGTEGLVSVFDSSGNLIQSNSYDGTRTDSVRYQFGITPVTSYWNTSDSRLYTFNTSNASGGSSQISRNAIFYSMSTSSAVPINLTSIQVQVGGIAVDTFSRGLAYYNPTNNFYASVNLTDPTSSKQVAGMLLMSATATTVASTFKTFFRFNTQTSWDHVTGPVCYNATSNSAYVLGSAFNSNTYNSGTLYLNQLSIGSASIASTQLIDLISSGFSSYWNLGMVFLNPNTIVNLAVDNTNNVYVLVGVSPIASGFNTNYAFVLLKINAGVLLWTKLISPQNGTPSNSSANLIFGSDGYLYMSFDVYDSTETLESSIYFYKFDTSGNVVWQRNLSNISGASDTAGVDYFTTMCSLTQGSSSGNLYAAMNINFAVTATMPVLLPSDSVTPLFARASQYSAIVKIPSDGSGVSTTAYGNFLKYRNNNPYGYTVSTLSNTWTSLTTVSTIPYTYSGLLITDVTTFNATSATSVSAFSAARANKTGLTTLSTWQGTVFYAYNGTNTVRSLDSGNTWSNYGTGLANYKTGWSTIQEEQYMMVADNSNNIHWTTSTNIRTGLSWFTATITSPVVGSITKLHGSTYGILGVALVPSSSTVYISTTNPPTTWSKLSGYCPDAVCSSNFYMVGVSNTGTTGAYLSELSPTAWTLITQIYASKLILSLIHI